MGDGFTAELAQRAATLAFEDLPDDVVEIARQCVLDWFGVTVAGSAEPVTRILLDEAVDGGAGADAAGGPGAGGCTVIGHGIRLPLADAALVNGTASHALDYDDVNEAMIGHPSVPILGALLALAEHRHASGRELVTAFVAGYEAECRVGRAVGTDHYQRGFHATGTVGTFGAAAACARLLGLDAATTAMAFGIAGTTAAGLKANFGTMGKPLHAGQAGVNGLRAARFAAGGFVANPAILETTQGFGEATAGGLDGDRGRREPRRGWHLRENLFKYHAACFQTHSSIEGLRRLRDEHGLRVDDVARVVVHADPMQLRMCAIPDPATGLEIKFSLRHTAALVLAGCDTSAIATYTDGCATDPSLVAVRERIEVAADGSAGGPTAVDVELRDGRVLHVAHDVSVPEDDLGLQREQLRHKCVALAGPVIGRDAAERLIGAVASLEAVPDVASLLALVAPAAS